MRSTSFGFGTVRIISSVMLLASVLLSGCSDPKSYEVTKLTEEPRKELGQKLTSDEGQKLAG
ncbi:MAG: hypothetical protein ABTS16_08135 [Candidatus Accumulibacter phosphatis]|jgi:hypothetical protein|uniref:Outer membrane protein assembly factor BamE n=1 Tax=Candidatus Accumulibacter contiguus TaxID=2954381 RepID=A0ABX1TE95_9PROT|nr:MULTISPECIES: hypothetical protein [Candidatus Accumulibacter]MBL8409456.1 hypothetical protein [Accumulibacter sp.]NMQ07261.1 hypothetical protein [Candidatus Accumulibacter contiguus]HRF12466.1 hypothetical protein [Candidatus Accumulibacter phosphatis]